MAELCLCVDIKKTSKVGKSILQVSENQKAGKMLTRTELA